MEMQFLYVLLDIVDNYLKALEIDLGKNKSKSGRDQRKRSILIYTYGLEGKSYSKDEIAMLQMVTTERVRQIQKEAIQEIRIIAFNQDQNGLFSKVYPELIEARQLLTEKRGFSYQELLTKTSIELRKDQDELRPIFDFFIDVFEFKRPRIHIHHLRDNNLILCDQSLDTADFVKVCHAIYLSVESNVVPIEFEDLIIQVRKKIGSINSRVSNEDIILGTSVIDVINITEINKKKTFQIRFDKLSSSSDMAYRILFEKNEQIKLAEILRELNYRIHNTERKKVKQISLNAQLNIDKRFVPLGKSGYWTLKEWNLRNKSMYEMISDTLTLFNKPLRKQEIFDYIHKTRPNIPTRSLDTVIYNDRFAKIEGNKFILKEWKEIYKDKIITTKPRNLVQKENPIRLKIKDQIVELFQQNNSKEILLSTIVKSLHKNFKFPKASIYKIISEEVEFETKSISSLKKIVIYKQSDTNMKSTIKSTSIFVSYSWGGEEQKNKVISFVDFLRKKGFEADMDLKFMQEETSVDFNRLMHQGILKYDKVIVLLSESYKNKAESFDGGVGKEYKFIIQDINKHPKKYILASFDEITRSILEEIVPIEFSGREVVDLYNDELMKFQKLFSKLTDTQTYIFSDVASNTPLVEQKKIEKFTLHEK